MCTYVYACRQWVLRRFTRVTDIPDLLPSSSPGAGESPGWEREWWEAEREALDNYLLLDVRNNSAWNQVGDLYV